MSLAAVATAGLGFLQTIVLSRLLRPEDFGLSSMVWVVLGMVDAYADMGMTQALIVRQDATKEQLSSVYWTIAAGGTVSAAAIVALTPALVWFYRQPAIVPLIPIVAASFWLACLGKPFQVILQRNLRFDTLSKAEIASSVSGLVVSVIAASRGLGAFSLVFGSLAAAFSKSALIASWSWREWHPNWHFRLADISGYLRFGAFRMGEATSNYISANVDYLAVGRFAGAEALGIYRLAYELVVRPLSTINPILNTVALPLFARKQSDDDALRRGYLELVRLIATLAFPLLAGLAVTASVAIPLIFGKKWVSAIPLVQVLCLMGMCKTISNPVGSLLLAKGRVDIGFYSNLILAVINTIVFWIAAQISVLAVAYSWVVIVVLFQAASWKSFYYTTIRLSITMYLRALAYPVGFTVFMSLTVTATLAILLPRVQDQRIVLALAVAEGAVTYVALHLFFDRAYFRALLTQIFHNPFQDAR